MGFLRRVLGGGGEPIPAWASFFDAREYRAFLDAVAADLERRGLLTDFGDGVVHVRRSEPPGQEPHQFGLGNLAQLCHASPRADWSRIIATHFTSLLAIQGRDLDALAADYEQVAPILRVRLMPDESMGGIELPTSVVRRVAPGILAVLVFDFPDSTAGVRRDHLAGWPVDETAAFEQALDNLGLEPAPLAEEVSSGDARFTLWYADGFYVATRVLRLADRLPEDTHHAIVAVPNRHTLLVHPAVDAGGVIASMQAIHLATTDLFRDGPGSISDQPYWWHEGRLTQIPHRLEGDQLIVRPPDDFVTFLEGLAESGDIASGGAPADPPG